MKKTWNILSKINENPIQNHSKHIQKSTQNLPKMVLLRGLGGLLGDPRGFLGRLEADLRAKMAPSWILEASKAV